MSTLTKSFTAAGSSVVVSLRPKQSATYNVSGTFTGYASIQKSMNGGQSWERIARNTVDTAMSGTIVNETPQDVHYRFYAEDTDAVTPITGTIVCVFTDVSDTIYEFRNPAGDVMLRITDTGVQLPGTLDVTGAASFAALLAANGEDTLTAHAGGTQAAALALSATKEYHRISVCATAADSVALPAATVGQAHYIRNDGAAAAQVFGTTPDTINGVATATGVSLPAGTGQWYICTTAAKWTTPRGTAAAELVALGLGVPTGTGNVVRATSPTLITPVLGVAAATSIALPTGTLLGEVGVRATADQSVTSNTTLADATSLGFAIGANEEWIGEAVLDVGAAIATTGLKLAVNSPTGATQNASAELDPDVTTALNSNVKRSTAIAGALTFAAATQVGVGDGQVRVAFWVLNGATPGTVQLQVAQATSSGTAVTIRKGSFMTARRVA